MAGATTGHHGPTSQTPSRVLSVRYRPACSKDGKTQFGNACQARCAGVTDFTLGVCHSGSMGSSGVGLQQTAADCKPGEVFKPFPCLVAPCKYGRCERCVNALGLQKEIEVAKPGAVTRSNVFGAARAYRVSSGHHLLLPAAAMFIPNAP